MEPDIISTPRGYGKTSQAIYRAKMKPESILVVRNQHGKSVAIAAGVAAERVFTHQDVINDNLPLTGPVILDDAVDFIKLAFRNRFDLSMITINTGLPAFAQEQLRNGL